MALSWINPLYLAGLLLLALPVLIHLVQRRHSRGLKFPSLMFLRQIPWREKRRLEIRHWLLLLLRCLLLALLALAFARPFLAGGAAVAPNAERSDSVIVIDRSYSMRLGERWPEARRRALELVDEKRPADRIGVIAFDAEPEVASDLSDNADDLRGAIRRLHPGLRATRLRAAIEQAGRLLEGSNAARRQILLISDFQAAAGDVAQLDRGIEIETYAVTAAAEDNAAIAALRIEAPAGASGDEFGLAVEVVNHGPSARERELTLSLNGRALPPRILPLAAGETSLVRFSGLTPGAGLLRGVVSLDDDALEIDNRAHFVYSDRQRIPVLIVESETPRANQSLYLEQALGLSRQPLFSLRRSSWQALQDTPLSAWSVIIVNDAAIPGGALGAALEEFVAAGGGLLVALGDTVQGNWPSGANGLLPGTLSRRVDAAPGAAERIVTSNAMQALLAGEGHDIDLSGARVYSYRGVEAGGNDRVLARYRDGGAALLEKRFGDGRVLVLTSTLDARWNDFALQPAFLPFLHRAMRYLAEYEPYANRFAIGSIVDVLRYARALSGTDAIVAAAGNETLVVEAPSHREIRLRRDSALLEIDEAGFYQVHRATPSGTEVVLAADVDSAESVPQKLDLKQFVEEIRASASTAPAAEILTHRRAGEYEQHQQIWFKLLLAVLAISLLEALLANRIAGGRFARKRAAGGRT